MTPVNPQNPIDPTQTAGIIEQKTPNSQAQQIANNLDAIYQAGNGYTDIKAQVAIAQGVPHPDNAVALSNTIAQGIKANTQAVSSFFSDPQQSRLPSATQQAAHALVSMFGHSIVYDDHVSKIQQDMINAGVAPSGAKATGIWDTQWTSALANSQNQSMQAPGYGNADSKSTVQHALGALSESKNTNVIIQVIKQTPRSLLQTIGGIVSGSSKLAGYLPVVGSYLKYFSDTKPLQETGRAIAQFGAKPENRTTTAEYVKQAGSWGALVNDVGNVLMFIPEIKAATGIKAGLKTATTGKVLTAAEVAPRYTLLNSIVSSAQKGELGLMQPSKIAFLNKPILNSIYKGTAQAIAKTAPMQIAVRNTLAQRLRLPVVRGLNQAGMAVLGAGLKEQGITLATSKLGGRDSTLDMTVYGKAPISGTLANALDIFGMQMNPGAIGKLGAKDIVGDTAKSAQALRNAFDDTGILRAWQRANPQIDYAKLVADHVAAGGSEMDILKEIGQQVNKLAVDHAVDFERNQLILDGTWAKMNADQIEKWTNDTKHAIWQEGATALADSRLNNFRESLVLNQNALETEFRDIGSLAAGDIRKVVDKVTYSPEEIKLLNEYATRPMLFSGNSPRNLSNMDALSGILGKSIIRSGTYYRGLSEKDMAEIVGRQENWQPYWSKGGKASPAQPAPWNRLVENTPEGGLKQGDIWDSGVHKSLTSDLESALKIAQEGGTGGGMTGAVAKIEINKPVNGIKSLNDISPMTNQTNEALISPSKLVLKKIVKGKYRRTRDNGVTDVIDEYVFGVADNNFVNKPALISKSVKGSTFPQKLQANNILESMINDNAHFLTPEFVANAKAGTAEGLAKSHVPTKNIDGSGEGGIGLARLETLTHQDAQRVHDELADQLKKATTSEQRQMVKVQIGKTLIEQYGINPFELGSHDAQDLLSIMETQGKKLAGDLHLAPTASAADKAKIEQLAKLGYKPVYGTDIGHLFTPGLQYTNLGAGDFTATAKAARLMGLSPRLSSSEAVSARVAVETNRAIQDSIDLGKIQVLPGFNASDLLAFIRQGLKTNQELTIGQKTVLGFAHAEIKALGKIIKRDNYEIPINKIMEAHANEPQFTRDDAWNLIKKAKTQELGLRETSPDVLRKILTAPVDKDVAALLDVKPGTPFMDVKSANSTIQAIWKGRVNVPLDMVGGVGKLEDILYTSWGVGNKTFAGKNMMALAELPSRFQNFRSRARYQESIVFAYRRMAKTMLKGITENIPPVMYPESKLEEMGIAKKAEALHQRIFPEDAAKNAWLDDSERIIKEADFYNLYSPREFEKWGAYWLNKQGFSDAEIAKKLENIMGYGERTAAERSLNAVFFPFSFNKTVMRQFGTMLISSPGKAMVTNQLMDLYDQVGGPKFKKWVDDNLPLIKQVEQLNALEHGIGLGQFGGINAPYFNALNTILGPKKIDYGTPAQNDSTMKSLRTYIPMIKEFTDLFLDPKKLAVGGQVFDTLRTLSKPGQMFASEGPLQPIQHTAMPDAAQQTAAWDYRSQLITGLSNVLKYNYQNPNNKAVWPDTIPVETGLRGKPVTKATIGEMVHYRYPAWDNTQSANVASRKATEADQFIGKITAQDPSRGADYAKFNEIANKVNAAVSKDNVSGENLANITDVMRSQAIKFAKKDPQFLDFYKTHYQRLFGPLEAFK